MQALAGEQATEASRALPSLGVNRETDQSDTGDAGFYEHRK